MPQLFRVIDIDTSNKRAQLSVDFEFLAGLNVDKNEDLMSYRIVFENMKLNTNDDSIDILYDNENSSKLVFKNSFTHAKGIDNIIAYDTLANKQVSIKELGIIHLQFTYIDHFDSIINMYSTQTQFINKSLEYLVTM